MDTGSRNTLIGTGLAILASVYLVLTDDAPYVVFWSLVVAGFLLVIVGSFQRAIFKEKEINRAEIKNQAFWLCLEYRAMALLRRLVSRGEDKSTTKGPPKTGTNNISGSPANQAQPDELKCLEEIKGLCVSMKPQDRAAVFKEFLLSCPIDEESDIDLESEVFMEVAEALGINRADAKQIIGSQASN